jgi:cell division transport system ATP-binding protein
MEAEKIIALNNINVFHRNILVLSDVSITVNKGEFVYLIGKTGSGKSSLMKVLYADLPAFDGEAIVAGFDLCTIRNKDIPFLRRKIGIVFQDFQLLIDRSIDDNMKFVMKSTGWKDHAAMDERIRQVFEKVGLQTKGFKFPHQLSAGEQQRVVIARALINDPAIILADEPTGNLDPETSTDILQLLHDISRGGTSVLMATHDYTMIHQFPGRTIKCENGKVFDSSN